MNHTPLESLGILSNVLQTMLSLPYRAQEGQLSHSFLAEHAANIERGLMRPQVNAIPKPSRGKPNERPTIEQPTTETTQDDRGSSGSGKVVPGFEG